MKTRVAINGFGRIGRATARIILKDFSDTMELIAINDPSPMDMTAHLFEFDTNYGRFPMPVSIEANDILNVGGIKIKKFTTRNISDLPWGDLKIDVVLECTGVFRTKEGASEHLKTGAKKVIISAPGKDDGFKTIVLGVNEETIQGNETLFSNASCTTNCLAPVVKILDEKFEIKSGLITTIHAYTSSQNVLDVGHKDFRRARAAAENMIPTTTGAAKAVGVVLPQLNGKLNGLAIRVPLPTVSIVDLVFKAGKKVSVEAVNNALKKASEKMPHILGFETKPLVSKDFQCDPRSSIVDADQTMVIDDLVKVMAWYDNEWGYSSRLVELITKVV
jgi:glyceraldehyde 3-phosphate dehydrogenase